MDSKIPNLEINKYFEEIQIYKQLLKKQISAIKEKYKDIPLSNEFLKEKDISIIFLLFSYCKQNIYNQNIGNIDENNNKLNEKNNMLIYFSENSFSDYKYYLLYYWQHYLIISLIQEIQFFLLKKDSIIIDYSTKNINRLLYLFEKNNEIIVSLYKRNIINIRQMINLMDIYIIWIEENDFNLIKETICCDKYSKIKNYYIVKILLNLLKNIFLIELKIKNKENNLKQLFEYLDKFISFINLYNVNFSTIILNEASIHNLILSILQNLDLEYYNKYKMNLINFYKYFLKDNFNKSRILEKIINNIKNSFMNLSIIKKDKNANKFINNDLLIQNFYFELLNVLYDEISDMNCIKLFNFNGIDSKMSFKLFNCSMVNTLILFSFCLKSESIDISNDSKVYPLFTLYDESLNKNIFKFYIKQNSKTKKNNLYIKVEGNDGHIKLNDFKYIKKKDKYVDKNVDLKNDTVYYIALQFNAKSIIVFLKKSMKEIKLNKAFSEKKDNIIQIGYDKLSQEYFKGTFGSFFILRNQEVKKNWNKILALREKYSELIYSLSNNSIYNFDIIQNFKYYLNTDKEQLDIINSNYIKENKNKLECLLYLTPSIIESYSDIPKSSVDKYFLPLVPDICQRQKYNNISELNSSIIDKENIKMNFLMDNGLYFICLQYEYLYQLLMNIKDIPKENCNNILLENKEIINNILINSINILIKNNNYILNFYEIYKMIFLNLFYCIKYFNKMNAVILSDKFIQNIGELVVAFVNNFLEKSNINKNDKRKLLIFRDGLIDLLLSSELYDNANFETLKFNFSLLFSLNKNERNSIFESNKTLLWKILNFVRLLENDNKKEKLIEDQKEIKNNEQIDKKIFEFLKEYFIAIKYKEYSQNLFSDLLHYCISNFENEYDLIYKYFNLIYELISNEYYFEKNELQILIDYIHRLIKNNHNNFNNEKNIINEKNENNNINNINDENNKIKQNILLIVLKILIDLVLVNAPDKAIKKNMKKLIQSIKFSHELLDGICNELLKLFDFLINNRKEEIKEKTFKLYINNHERNISKTYYGFFKFLITILNSIINNEDINKNDNIMKTNEVLSLLISINKRINEELQNEIKNEDIYICLLNYTKFFYKIVLSEDIFNNFSFLNINIFILNLCDFVYICNEKLFLNTNILIDVKKNKRTSLKKTFIEIIFDIYMNILLNEKFEKSHKLLYESLKIIFDNIKIGKNKYTIFFYNDYLINLFNKKKLKNEEQKLKNEICKLNDILSENNCLFEMSFTTFFLLKIASYIEYIKINVFKNDKTLNEFLQQLIEQLILEHMELYKLKIDVFSKVSVNNFYNELKNIIMNNLISKKSDKIEENIFSEFKDFFHKKLSGFYNPISEEITSGNCNNSKNEKKIVVGQRHKSLVVDPNIVNNLVSVSHRPSLHEKRKNSAKLSNDISLNLKPSLSFKEKNNNIINFISNPTENTTSNIQEQNEVNPTENNNNILQLKEDEKNIDEKETIEEIKNNINIESNTIINLEDHFPLKQKAKIKQINLSEFTNSIYFFEDIDTNYIKNYKKYLMNNIFSLYFIDTFYHNNLFQKMKLYYLNNYKDAANETKTLIFPSKYKNFNNGLEPGMFLKQHKYFFESKYFPISHPYFVNYLKENNIYNKSIILYPKNLPNYLFNNDNQSNSFKIDAELVKIKNEYFGEIFIFNFGGDIKFLIFQEKEYIPNDLKDDFLDNKDNYKYLFSLTFSNDIEKRRQKNKIKQEKRIKNKTIVLFFNEIEEIMERRFFLMWNGCEIFLKNGKSYLFNLFSSENKNEIMNIFKNDEKLKHLIHTKDYLTQRKEISKEWKKYHIPTYEYLLLVNKYGSRTFNNNDQYPIFPWIVINDYSKLKELNETNFNDDLLKKYFNNNGENLIIDKKTRDLFNIIRKTKFPICIQTIEKQNEFIEKYAQEEDKFKYHLGIHYATASYIFYYLMRQEPYSDLLIKLQNYQQENPNRMFIGINESISLLENSKDPRELIPELYSRFEYLINLNCAFFGRKSDNIIVDDNVINFFSEKKNSNPFYQYITFIIEQRKLLNSKILSITINDWIDNVFGFNQIPKNAKLRENCCNIFTKTSYEQELNLQTKLEKYITKYKNNQETKENILKKILAKINSIINFGQTPYQIFKEKHCKRKINKLFREKNEEENEIKKNGEEGEEDKLDELEKVVTIIRTQKLEKEIRDKYNYIYFDINPKINKLFMLSEENEERYINILNINFDNKNSEKDTFISNHDCFQIPYFISYDKIKENHYYIYKIKYAFSSFNNYEGNENYKNINTKEIYHTFSREIITNIKKVEKISNKNVIKNTNKNINKTINKNSNKSLNKNIETNENIYYKFITCRYIDNSFKIHRFPKYKNNNNKKDDIYKPISYICEEFVCSCCTISFCQFLIGLKNGKLIQFYIEQKEDLGNKNTSDFFNIKIEKYIQAHFGKINVIEINRRLGIIITCGDDNYILIRKLYDFELLSPIKIKNKYIITLAKVSPLNFLYIVCYNKEKNTSVIFGYTLTGLKFAKSDYGFYDNIDFTLNGNIVTFKNRKELYILSGNDLDYIKMNKNDKNDTDYDDFVKKNNKVKDSIWMKYDYFINEESNYSKIITYYKIIDNRKLIAKLDVSQNKYFD